MSVPAYVRELPRFTMIAHVRQCPPRLVQPVRVHFTEPLRNGDVDGELWFWWSDDPRFGDVAHNGHPRQILADSDALHTIGRRIGYVVRWVREDVEAAEERDAFCLDAARKTIDDVRRLVKAGPLEATTDAVARALRKEGGE